MEVSKYRIPVILIALSLGQAPDVRGQQFVVDDAEVVDHMAFQLEAWYGQHSSWILPAFSPIENLELASGLGIVNENGSYSLEYVAQAKYIFKPLETNSYGIGIAVGIGAAPIHQTWRAEIHDLFAYLPVSLSLMNDVLILHGNLGWIYEMEGHVHNGHVHDDPHHVFTWGVRSDVALTDRLTLIGELFGEDRFLPEWHVGLRTAVIPDGLEMDVSYGRHFDPIPPGVGFNIGMAWTPPPFR